MGNADWKEKNQSVEVSMLITTSKDIFRSIMQQCHEDTHLSSFSSFSGKVVKNGSRSNARL